MSAGRPERGPVRGPDGGPAPDGPAPDGPPAADGAIDDYSARVLDLVDAIPPGQVMSYGDIAEYLGEGGPRQVGRVMSRYGGGAPWWRVIHSDGTPPPGHDAQALRHYMAEHTPLRSAARPVRVDMGEARWTGPPGPEPAGRWRPDDQLAERRLATPNRPPNVGPAWWNRS
jgi:alkylated DNA nucleotide flippase Atl1